MVLSSEKSLCQTALPWLASEFLHYVVTYFVADFRWF